MPMYIRMSTMKQNSFEFKFYDTRLSSYYEKKCCFLTLQKSRRNKKISNGANLILITRGKSGIIKFEFKTTLVS